MNPLMISHTQLYNHSFQELSLVKREQQFNNLRPEIPPWLGGEAFHGQTLSPLDFSSAPLLPTHYENPNPTTSLPPFQSNIAASSSPNMSATALLQKTSQMGATVSKTAPSTAPLRPHLLQQQDHVPECTTITGYNSFSSMPSSSPLSGSMVIMPSREEIRTDFSYGNKAAMTSANNNTIGTDQESSFFLDMMGGGGSNSGTVHNASGFESSSFEEAMRGMFNNPPRDDDKNFQELVSKSAQSQFGNKSNKGDNDEITRDFLGLGAFSQRGFFNISGFDHLDSSSYGKQNQNQAPWQG